MQTYIALFRGINVGGKHLLPMKQLVSMLESLGLTEVKTYIQSGNAVFKCREQDSRQLAKTIGSAVSQQFGFKPEIMLLTLDDLQRVIRANPFPEAESEPSSLHVGFLASVPANPNLQALAKLADNGERFAQVDQAFYLHAPAGIARSKLAAGAEKQLGVAVTSRNWRSACKILEIAQA